MSWKPLLLWFFIVNFLFIYQANGRRSNNLSPQEDLELRKQLRALDKPAVETIRTIHGDVYRCVDFYKQPAFDHPLLKNHTFHPQMKPRFLIESLIRHQNTSHIGSDTNIWVDGKGCPTGTVPIRRVTKSDLIQARLAAKMNPLSNELPGVLRAIARTKSNGRTYAGASTIMSRYNPSVVDNSQYTGSQMTIQSGIDGIQTGWIVNPTLNKDNRTRLFIYTKAGELQCFNLLCPGFILASSTVPVDQVLEPVTPPGGGKVFTDRYTIKREPTTGDWYLTMGFEKTIVIGMWPQKIFTSLAAWATYVDWGGVAYSSPGHQFPVMGTGHWPVHNLVIDAFCADLQTLNEDGGQFVDATDTEVHEDDNSIYRAGDYEKGGGLVHHVMFYGGPGRFFVFTLGSPKVRLLPPSTARTSLGELACTYASLLLHDDGIPITAEKISSLVKAADVKIDSYWPGLFAKLFEKRSIDDLILNVGSGGSFVAVAAPIAEAAAPIAEAAAPAKEEKKEVVEEESDEDMSFSLFDE